LDLTPAAPIGGGRLFLTGALSFALIGMLPALYGVSVPAFGRIYDLAEEQAALIISAHGIGAFVAVFAGIFGLRWLTLRLSLASMAAGGALVSVQLGWPLILVGATLLGAGFGLVSVIVNRRFLTEYSSRGPAMVGLVNAVFGVGAIASPYFFLWAGSNPWPVFAGIGIAALTLIALVQPSGKSMSGGVIGLPPWQGARMLILVPLFLSVLLEVGLFGFGPSALIAAGTPEVAAAKLASAFFVAFLMGRLALYWLGRHVAAAWLFLIGVSGVGICCIWATSGWPEPAFVLAGGLVGMTFPMFFVWGSETLGGDPRIASVILAAGLSGAATGPLILGLGLQYWGIAGLFGLLGVIAAATAGCAILGLVVLRRQLWA
jgi:fucose permease